MSQPIDEVDPQTLADLFSSLDDAGLPRAWAAGPELGEVLAHQLRAPVAADLKLPSAGRMTFGELLAMERPPVEVLRVAKDFFKAALLAADGPLPHDVARLLYYGAIGVAGARLGESISSLSRAELSRGLKWATDRTWLPEPLRATLRGALAWARGEDR